MSDTSAFAPDLEIPEPDEPAESPAVEATEPVPATADEETAEDETPTLAYPNAGAWVNGWLLPHYRRELGGSKRRWDPNWWHYEEVGGRTRSTLASLGASTSGTRDRNRGVLPRLPLPDHGPAHRR